MVFSRTFIIPLVYLVLGSTVLMAQSESEGRWLIHNADDYSIEYPSNWLLSTNGFGGSDFFIKSTLESSSDVFQENVNLLVQDLAGMGLDINSFTELSEAQIKAVFGNSQILLSERIQGKLGEYHRLIYTGQQGNFQLKFEQLYLIRDQYAYVLTFTSEEPQFNRYKTTGERILNSFKLK